MRRMTKMAVQFFFSISLVFALAFGAAAQPGGGKGSGGEPMEGTPAAKRTPGPMGESSEEAREEKEKALERMDEARHRDETEKEETPPSGLEKQREKKMEQERKEQDKGSEQGQRMREEHSRKWWKFWD